MQISLRVAGGGVCIAVEVDAGEAVTKALPNLFQNVRGFGETICLDRVEDG